MEKFKVGLLERWMRMAWHFSTFQVSGSSVGLGSGNFPVNSALMIGDYVTPGSIILPTQGIQLNTHTGLAGSDNSQPQWHPVPR